MVFKGSGPGSVKVCRADVGSYPSRHAPWLHAGYMRVTWGMIKAMWPHPGLRLCSLVGVAFQESVYVSSGQACFDRSGICRIIEALDRIYCELMTLYRQRMCISGVPDPCLQVKQCLCQR